MAPDLERWICSMIEAYPDFKNNGRIPMCYEKALRDQGLKYQNGHLAPVATDGSPVEPTKEQRMKISEFEQCLKSGTNTYVEQGRHMEDVDAKADAKDLLEIARKQIVQEIDARSMIRAYLDKHYNDSSERIAAYIRGINDTVSAILKPCL